jgi:hypothetical protein
MSQTLLTTPVIVIGFSTVSVYDSVRQRNHVLSYQYYGKSSRGYWSGIIYTDSGDPEDRIEFRELLGKAIEHGREEGHLLRTWPREVYAAAYFTRGDLPSFRDFKDLYSQFDWVRRTFISMTSPYDTNYYDANRNKHSLEVRLVDSKLLAPDTKGLDGLGRMHGLSTIALPAGMTNQMDVLLREDKPLYENYAIRRAETACLHAWMMIEFGKEEFDISRPAVTLGSLSTHHIKRIWKGNDIVMSDVLGKVSHPSSKYNPQTQRRETSSRMVSIPAVHDNEAFVRECYHGGRNEAYAFGPSDNGFWIDYDLPGAYTTAMAAIKIPDYEAMRHTTDLDDFRIDELGFARVTFKFPEGTRFPCLPVRYEDGLIFPLEGTTHVASPEIRLALDMGAELTIEEGLVVPWKSEVRPFVMFAKSIRDKRASHEKGSVEELAWKEIGNSLYGKLAQGLKERRINDPRPSSGKEHHQSEVSQVYLAAYLTSLIRAVIGELLHRIPPDKTVISATTDGFITNTYSFDNHGPLCQLFSELRILISDDPAILESKHGDSSIVSIKTRGQVSAELGIGLPLVAKASVKVPLEVYNEAYRKIEDWPEEGYSGYGDKPSPILVEEHVADWFKRQFLFRTPDTVFRNDSLAPMRELLKKGSEQVNRSGEIALNLEYDWKRELINPVEREVKLGGLESTSHLYADSVPWKSIDEFKETRLLFDQWRKKEGNVLKTMEDWESWERFRQTGLVSKRGIKRTKEGIAGQAKRLIVRAYVISEWGLGTGTYREFADLLTEAGYPTTKDTLKNAKRSPLKLQDGQIPVDPEVIKLVKVILEAYPGFEWWRLFDDLESELLEELSVRGKAAE